MGERGEGHRLSVQPEKQLAHQSERSKTPESRLQRLRQVTRGFFDKWQNTVILGSASPTLITIGANLHQPILIAIGAIGEVAVVASIARMGKRAIDEEKARDAANRAYWKSKGRELDEHGIPTMTPAEKRRAAKHMPPPRRPLAERKTPRFFVITGRG